MNIWFVVQWTLNAVIWWWVFAGIWPWQYIGKPRLVDICDWMVDWKVENFLDTEGMKALLMEHPDYQHMKPGDRVLVEVAPTKFRGSHRAGLFILDADRKPFTLRLAIQLFRKAVRNKIAVENDMYSPEYVDELVATKG